MIGHAIASRYDPSILMALNVTESLLNCQKFDGSDILSKHLYLYHKDKCEIGATTKYIYQQATHGRRKPPSTHEDFRFEQSAIDSMVQGADQECGGRTAGCAPAHRSYPLALCHYISDEDLFECSVKEAKLTHYNPIAGQVAGIINVICRSLIKNISFRDAVNSAFEIPRLHPDVQSVAIFYGRRVYPPEEKHAAYAPTVLCAALHYVSTSRSAAEAIAKAHETDKHYCAPIVGILAGTLWGIPMEMYKDNIQDAQLKTLRQAAGSLSSMWPSVSNGPNA